MIKKILLGLSVSPLIVVVILLSVTASNRGDYRIPDLEIEVVSDVPAWVSQDLPISTSEGAMEAAIETLGYERSLYRTYRRDNIVVAIWVAYWKPGQKDVRAVHWHSPDTCWVSGGWRNVIASDDYSFGSANLRLIQPGNYRFMEKNSENVHILFWHLVGGKKFGVNSTYKSLLELPEILFRSSFTPQAEQYFIRISSNRDFEDLKSDEGFIEIMKSIKAFGI